MIFAICGTPGSYKSAYAMEKFLIPALREGREVYTNLDDLSPEHISVMFDIDPLTVEHKLHVLGRVYDDDGTYHEDPDLIRYFYRDLPLNSLVIIDEAQNYYSSRDFKEKYSADLINWLTKSRHLGCDVVWITQNLEAVDITFRRNTHLTYAMRRAENLGLKNMSFMYIYDRADLDRRHLSRKTYHPDPSVFKCYASYQSESVVEKRKSYNVFLRSPFVWLMIVVAVWLGYTLLSGNFARIWGGGRAVPKNLPKKEVVIENKQEVKNDGAQLEKESVISFDDKCILKTSKIRGVTTYYFSDGSSSSDSFGFKLCR